MTATATPMTTPIERIQNLMRDFTIEVTPGQAKKVEAFSDHLREGCNVAVTFLPGSDYNETIETAKRLRDEGFVPMPHFAARSITSQAEFEDFLGRCVNEAGVDSAVVLAGGVDKPLGPYDSSMALLETGLFDKMGIKQIGVAGHPEGSPDINDEMLKQALAWKNSFAERTDAHVYIATQFVFEAAPIIAWDKALQADGNKLPIHIGAPGLATIKTLMAHAKACGVGPSIRFLTRQALNVAKLMTVSAPDKLITELAEYKATDPNCGIDKVHMYPLGGLKRSAFWSNAVVDGQFKMKSKGDGFDLTVDLP